MSEEAPMVEVVPVAPVIISAGSRLTAARTAAGLSIAEVARHLKLSPLQVEALETGDHKKLPGPVFVRGFMRNYARLVNLDPVPLIADVVAAQNQEAAALVAAAEPEKAIPFPGQASWNWKPYAIGLVLVVAGLAVYEFFDGVLDAAVLAPAVPAVDAPQSKAVVPPESATETKIEKNENAAVAAPAMMGGANGITSMPSAPTKVATVERSANGITSMPSAPAKVATVERGANGITSIPPAPTKVATVERSANDKVLRFSFAREAWVEIRDAKSRVIFSQLNAAGSNPVVSGEPPFNMVIGNASGVKLVFGERAVDLAPYTQVDVARLTLE